MADDRPDTEPAGPNPVEGGLGAAPASDPATLADAAQEEAEQGAAQQGRGRAE
jgi:hypothetical protein